MQFQFLLILSAIFHIHDNETWNIVFGCILLLIGDFDIAGDSLGSFWGVKSDLEQVLYVSL